MMASASGRVERYQTRTDTAGSSRRRKSSSTRERTHRSSRKKSGRVSSASARRGSPIAALSVVGLLAGVVIALAGGFVALGSPRRDRGSSHTRSPRTASASAHGVNVAMPTGERPDAGLWDGPEQAQEVSAAEGSAWDAPAQVAPVVAAILPVEPRFAPPNDGHPESSAPSPKATGDASDAGISYSRERVPPPTRPESEAVAVGEGGVSGGVGNGTASSAAEAIGLEDENLAPNPGFEEAEAETRIPKRWRTHCWGRPNAKHTARIDDTFGHSGSCALVVRSYAEDGKPGAYVTLSLDPGTYQLTYWACAEVGEEAEVQAHLAGENLPAHAVGEEWRQFAGTVEVKKKEVMASVKIWTSSYRVRVWFDDVGLTRVR